MMKKLLFLFAFFILGFGVKSWANLEFPAPHSFDVYMATWGWNGSCVSSSPCNSSTMAIAMINAVYPSSGMQPGTTMFIHLAPGLYSGTHSVTSTAYFNLTESLLKPHTSAWLVVSGDSMTDQPNDPTSNVVFTSYVYVFTMLRSSYTKLQNVYIMNGRGSQAIDIRDSNHFYGKNIGMKNACLTKGQYNDAITLGSNADGGFVGPDNNPNDRGADDCLLEDIWIDGVFHYGILIGGTTAYSERNVIRRCVVRWGGNNGANPNAGISVYGVTGQAQGAIYASVQNSIAFDFNESTFQTGGGGLYAGFYSPWGAKSVDWIGDIAYNLPCRGWIMGEAYSSSNTATNCIAWDLRGSNAYGFLTNATQITSMTVRNCTVGYAQQKPLWNGNSVENYTSDHNIFYRSMSVNSGVTVDDWNNYFPSTANTAGSTNEKLVDMTTGTLLWITSIPVTSPLFGVDISSRIGAHIEFMYGTDGTFYGEPGYVNVSTVSFLPFPNSKKIYNIFCEPDTPGSDAALLNPGNYAHRGFCEVGSLEEWLLQRPFLRTSYLHVPTGANLEMQGVSQ